MCICQYQTYNITSLWHIPPGNHKFILCESVLQITSFFQMSHKRYHVIFVFVWLFFIWNYFMTVSGDFAHTILSLSLSLPPFPAQGPHMYTNIMCVKMTVVFFGERDLFFLKKWTTLLPRYSDEHKICEAETSKLQHAWVRGMSTTINSKLGRNGPALSGLQGQTYTQFSCCS